MAGSYYIAFEGPIGHFRLVQKRGPKSYILMTRPNPVQEAVLRLRGVEAVVRTGTDPGTPLSGFLQQLLNEVAVA